MKHSLLRIRSAATALALLCGIGSATAQATLGNSPYTENFDQLANGLPTGFSVRTGASATALGTPATLGTTAAPASPTSWNTTSGGFYNYASGTSGLTSTATSAEQAAATNRALGIRQTTSLGNPGGAFVFQIDNTTAKTNFALRFKLQSLDASSPRITTWQVDYGIGSNPTTFTTVGSSATTGDKIFGSKDIAVDFGSQLDNQTGPVWIRIVTLTTSGNSSTGEGGNRPTSAIDDFALTWNTTAPNAPTLTVLPNGLGFGRVTLAAPSTVVGYTLTGTNLTGTTTITAPESFSVSKTATGTFGSTLTYTVAELATPQTVHVRFTPTVAGPVSGTITHTSPGAANQSVAVTGTGVDPNNLVFNFDECTAALGGWAQYSVTGAQTWACTTFGRDAADATGKASKPNGVQINGFANSVSVPNEDWFISPAFNTSSFAYPLFSFWSRTAFNGPPLKLRVSTNYSGTGNPLATGVTWTDLDVSFPAIGSDAWTQTAGVDLSEYKSQTTYVAFVYTSSDEESARWTLDDISLTNSATPPAPALATTTRSLDFGYVAANATATQTFTVTPRNLTAPFTVTATGAAFQVSKDGTTFGNSATYTVEEANNQTKTLTVRFRPTQNQQSYTGSLALASTNAPSITVTLSGNTYNTANTLEVVNWNVEWFGSTQNGPSNKDQQQTNVRTILNSLKADIYGLVEVVDTARLGPIVRQLPGGGYTYRVSDFGSYADNAQDPDYATAQKLAFVYNTNIFKNVVISSLFRCTQAENCPEFNYWSSGRFPYLLDADVTLNGATQHFTFVLIHAKANTSPTSTSYERRKNAADGLKAALDANYKGKNVIILGDFNDDLDQTITTGLNTTATSYSAFTTDVANYTALTLPLSLAGQRSTVGYNDVIDHVIVTKATESLVVPNSTEILTSVANLVTNYGNTTTDHYPVQTRYTFGVTTPTKNAAANRQVEVYPNPVTNAIRLNLPEPAAKTLHLRVLSVDGRQVAMGTGSLEQLNQQLNKGLSQLKAGVYIIQVNGGTQTYVKRFIKQ
ncbi:choice-of-anchor J domain-containing protein [Hymenobacter aerilatus]|uniref:Choice-of-anchor J domain-containing protein n=1 Tax=Hymenobacter aerilatus TaxID=2932251 RepID=A0A8T9SWM0_9BACT|nr:choice-of-anchor J domain-containing protein [Hymenobacter aerilatus]UOR06622.1 choice-of-anchor J domain-containing protein [Hymenobacter aerilatus]